VWFPNSSFQQVPMEEDTSKIRDATGTVFIQGPSIVLLVWRSIMFNDSFLRLGRPRHGARVWCLGRVPKHRNLWQEVEGLLFSPKKLSVGAYFELLFLGCGFLIHLSNRYDSTRFRAPWKKIHQKYETLQEPSLFKGHPLSCQYGEALCSMVPT